MAEEWSWFRRSAQQWLLPLVEMEFSGARALGWLREQGMGYRMQDFYEDWRGVTEGYTYRPMIKALPDEMYAPRIWMQRINPKGYNMSTPYQIETEVRYRDIETGEEYSRSFFPGIEEMVSMGEARVYVREKFRFEFYEPGAEMIGMEVVGWRHRGGAGY